MLGQDFVGGEVENAGKLFLPDNLKGRGQTRIDRMLLEQLPADAVYCPDEAHRELLGGKPEGSSSLGVVRHLSLFQEPGGDTLTQLTRRLLRERGGHDGAGRQAGGDPVHDLARQRVGLPRAGACRDHGDVVQHVHE